MRENKNILFICSAYQNNDDKLKHLKKNLNELKKQEIDICLTTHSSYGLDELASECKYIIYDYDNNYTNLQDLLDNLENIQNEKLINLFHSYYTFTFENQQQYLRTFFWESHSKPTLSCLKNAINLAKSKKYEWIVYFEYDIILPSCDLNLYFQNLIDKLENENKVGHAYMCPDSRHPLIWPMFFLVKTDVFYEDDNFKSNWQKSPSKFYANFGIQNFEQIIDTIIKKRDVIIEEPGEIIKNMDYQDRDFRFLTLFGAHMVTTDFFGKRNPLEFYNPKFYARKKDDDKYDLELFFISYEKIPDEQGVSLTVLEDNEIVFQTNLNIIANSYTYFLIYQNIDKNFEKVVELKMRITIPKADDFDYTYKFNLKNIEKYHQIFKRS